MKNICAFAVICLCLAAAHATIYGYSRGGGIIGLRRSYSLGQTLGHIGGGSRFGISGRSIGGFGIISGHSGHIGHGGLDAHVGGISGGFGHGHGHGHGHGLSAIPTLRVGGGQRSSIIISSPRHGHGGGGHHHDDD